MPGPLPDAEFQARFHDRGGAAFNIVAYGALGLGNAAANTAAINAAVTAAETAGNGAIVLVPRGAIFDVNATLEWGVNARIHVTGGGAIRKAFTSTAPVVRWTSGTISDITFDDAGNDQGIAINVEPGAAGERLVCEGVRFLSMPGSAIATSIAILQDTWLTIRDCYINDCGNGSLTAAPFTSSIRLVNLSHLAILDNVVRNGVKGIDLSVAGLHVVVEGNDVAVMTNIGIGVNGLDNFRIAGNRVSDTTDNGIDANGCDRGEIVNNVCRNVKDGVFCGENGSADILIEGNVVHDCETGVRVWDGMTRVAVVGNKVSQYTSPAGIRLEGTLNGTDEAGVIVAPVVVGNYVRGDVGSELIGIRLKACDRPTVSGNRVDVCTTGIAIEQITSAVRYGTVTANHVTAATAIGISVGAGCERHFVDANQIHGTSSMTEGVAIAGANGILGQNAIETESGGSRRVNLTGSNANKQIFPANDTTPSVGGGQRLFKTNNSSATSVTTFDDGYIGQEITVWVADANTTFVDGATLQLAGSTNYAAPSGAMVSFVNADNVWRETARAQT